MDIFRELTVERGYVLCDLLRLLANHFLTCCSWMSPCCAIDWITSLSGYGWWMLSWYHSSMSVMDLRDRTGRRFSDVGLEDTELLLEVVGLSLLAACCSKPTLTSTLSITW